MSQIHDLSRCEMQIAGPAVIAQPLPLSQHFILRGRCQILNRRPATHEPLPVVPALFHLCLLEDDL